MDSGKAPVISIQTRMGKHSVRPFFEHDKFRIYAATRDDVQDLAQLELRVFSIEQYGSDVLSPAHFRHLIKKGNATILIAKQGEELAGYVILLFRSNSDKARIHGIGLDSKFRGHGIGVVLMQSAEQLCKTLRLNYITLETRIDNRAMQGLGAREGYKKVGIAPAYYHDGTDAVKYMKTIEDYHGS